MHYASNAARKDFQHMLYDDETPIRCNRGIIKALLLQQWRELSHADIEATNYVKSDIATLIERKYGIHHRLAENYLNNLERTLPY